VTHNYRQVGEKPVTFPLEWYLLFLVGIPQAFLGLLLGLSLFNIRIPRKRFVLISFLGGTISFSIRLIPMIFGLHSILNFFIMALLLVTIGKTKVSQAVCSTMAMMVIIAVLESFIVALCFNITGVTYTTLKNNQILMVLFFLPEALLMVIMFLIINRTKFKMWDLNELG